MDNSNPLRLSDIHSEINSDSQWYDLYLGEMNWTWLVFLLEGCFCFVLVFSSSLSQQILLIFWICACMLLFLLSYCILSGKIAETCRKESLCLYGILNILKCNDTLFFFHRLFLFFS